MKVSRDIAIVGMGCLLPGARNIHEFWDNVLRQKDSITEIPDTHWNVDDYYDADPSVPDKSYCKRGGFLPTIDFDPMAYGIAPKDLDVLDSAQLLGMVVAKDALHDAGYLEERGGKSFDRDRCSVILGTTSITELSTPLNMRLASPTISRILDGHGIDAKTRDSILSQYGKSFPIWQENSFPGVLGNVVSGRIASNLNLGGTNCVIDAACASALGALKMATDALISGSCDMAISGGVDTINNVFMYMCFSKTPAFSASGKTRPFDKDSDGILIAEGIALTVLKRLDDALRDGDRIYSIIKAVGSSSDGKSRSVYQPVSTGQSKAIRQAHLMAGIKPEDIGLIEAHGTGTRVGDATELQGLHAVFGKPGKGGAWCALGSVKSQIGHAKACAGMAGLLKAALATYHKVLPGTINVSEPSPKLELDDSAFYLNTQPRPWITQAERPRTAGISAFGFGGTNFHVILGESTRHIYPRVASPVKEFFPFTAEDSNGLVDCLMQNLEILKNVSDFHAYARFVQHQVNCKLISRAGLMAESLDELKSSIMNLINHLKVAPKQSYSGSDGIHYFPDPALQNSKVGVIFSGQGSQYLGMLRSSYLLDPVTQQALENFEKIREQRNLISLAELVWPPEAFDSKINQNRIDRLKQTDNAQSALAYAHLSMTNFLKKAGLQVDGVAGHSFGELSALLFSSVIDAETYCLLALERGRLMQESSLDESGSMMAVLGDRNKAIEIFENAVKAKDLRVVLANENSPIQCVISGNIQELNEVKVVLEKAGLRIHFLPVGAAFHSPLMDKAAQAWKSFLKEVNFKSPLTPVYACSTGKPYPKQNKDIQDLLGDQLRNPVKFIQQIEKMYADGIRIFVDAGPSRVCSKLIHEILEGKDFSVLECDRGFQGDEISQWRSHEFLSQVIAQLFAMGKVAFDPLVFGEMVAEAPVMAKMSPVTVKLNGANYLRNETREAPFAAPEHPIPKIENKNQSNDLQKSPISVKSTPSPEFAINRGSLAAKVSTREPITARRSNDLGVNGAGKLNRQAGVSMSGNDQAFREMGEFHRYRMKMLEVHEQFLQTQSEANRLYEKMLFGGTVHENWSHPAPNQGFTPSDTVIARAQETPKVQYQAPVTIGEPQNAPALVPSVQSPGPMIHKASQNLHSAPSETVSSQQVRNGSLLSSMFEKKPVEAVVSSERASVEATETIVIKILADKTGFPVEMLTLDMDLEADLAVDSIRRVEILGAVQESFPDSPSIAPSDMGTIKTIRDLCLHLGGESQIASKTTVEDLEEVSSQPSNPEAPDHEILKELMNVIADKTGFPLEMLNKDMDLEDDLAVDSIRRVEILGAIRERFPKAPTIDPTQMGVLKTIEDLVGHLSESMNDFLGTDPKKKSQMA